MHAPAWPAVLALLAIGPDAAADWPEAKSVAAFAWLGSWQAMQYPTVPAPTEGEVEGELGPTFRVEWRREGEQVWAKVARTDEGWCGRLGIEFRFGTEAKVLNLGYFDLPVEVPLAETKEGQTWWTWSVGVPRWIHADETGASVLVESTHQHGCFLIRRAEGCALQVALDAPALNESVEFAFRLRPRDGAAALQAASRERLGVAGEAPVNPAAARAGRQGGFLRVDESGAGFVLADGHRYFALGQNLPHLMTFTPVEQERALAELQAVGVNTTRFLLPCSQYRPTPGRWNEEAVRRLRETLDRCAARGIRVIVCLEYSAHGYQYNSSLHRSPSPGDLYLLEEALAWYRDTIRRIVEPLRDDPAVLAWDVTNEPFLEPDPKSVALAEAFRDWSERRYGTIEALRGAWGEAAPASFAEVDLPSMEAYEKQADAAARDYFTFANAWLAERLIQRAQLVRAADPNHLITVSHWNPRLFRGHAGAGAAFDFWAPHTYDLWLNGPTTDRHVAFLVESLQHALPDRPRPVLIEEFGINPGPKYPSALCAEHIREFITAARRHGAAGLLHWWELTPEMRAAFAEASQPAPLMEAPAALGVYLPSSQEWNLLLYDRYMTRRRWDGVLERARDAGLQPRFIGAPEEVAGCAALLVLGDGPRADEVEAVRKAKPAWVVVEAEAARAALPEAEVLPEAAEEQAAMWARIAQAAMNGG
ncbi:MAG: hypothetical protein FJX74_02865 [Armatimonadetes bacterium]|nr:hypothetical protein [Armatimonadota bacterium]